VIIEKGMKESRETEQSPKILHEDINKLIGSATEVTLSKKTVLKANTVSEIKKQTEDRKIKLGRIRLN